MLATFVAVLLCHVALTFGTNVCPDGYFGPECQYSCSSGCLNDRCRVSRMGSDECVDGCEDGYSGSSCRSRCPPYCLTCDRLNDTRCHTCRDFRYGESCEMSCRDECPAGCNKDGSCLPDERSKCSENCQNCDTSRGICTYCKVGFHGEYCDFTCSPNCGCSGDIADDDEEEDDTKDVRQACARHCEQISGNCTYSCKIGHFGEKCQFGCNHHCKDFECDRKSGRCLKGCADGFYGPDCTSRCGGNCAHGICEQKGGICSNGCSGGYWGKHCKKSCGDGCQVCHRNTGECIPFTETSPNVAEVGGGSGIDQPNDQDPGTIFGILAVAVLCFLLITLTIGALIRFYVRRLRQLDGYTSTSIVRQLRDPQESYAEFNSYSEICECHSNKDNNITLESNISIPNPIFDAGTSRPRTASLNASRITYCAPPEYVRMSEGIIPVPQVRPYSDQEVGHVGSPSDQERPSLEHMRPHSGQHRLSSAHESSFSDGFDYANKQGRQVSGQKADPQHSLDQEYTPQAATSEGDEYVTADTCRFGNDYRSVLT